jgi:predicted  nucleic acid-binding Zn-ribbon protein
MVGNVLVAKVAKHSCTGCGKVYKDNSGLWRHKKKCSNITMQDLHNEEKQQQLVEYLLKENSEFKQMMLEQNKQMIELAKNAGHNTNIHNTTNNTHNQSFNLQFFLNETCKDAMNIMDFVSQLQVCSKDLEETGRIGFANGISKIFINGLKQINISDRPIHCSDMKRETLYIKNNNEWNKEDEDKKLLTNAIKHVAHKGIKQISVWTKEHPGFNDPESKVNDRYLKIVSESMSGSTEDETNKNYTKIIKNIVKETVIDK